MEKWTVVWESGLAPGDRRPPFSDLTVEIDSFTDGGSNGSLRLDFINDRLFKVAFAPLDAEAYFRDPPPGWFWLLKGEVGLWRKIRVSSTRSVVG